jgi:hypothetical protein
MPKTRRHTGCRANKTSTPLATWQRCSKEETVHSSSLTHKTAKPFKLPSSGVTPLVTWRVSTAYQRTPNPIPNRSALVSACFVFWLFASVQRSLPMPLEACRKPKAKRPSRSLPPATIRPESFVLHEIARAESDAQAVPQRRCVVYGAARAGV